MQELETLEKTAKIFLNAQATYERRARKYDRNVGERTEATNKPESKSMKNFLIGSDRFCAEVQRGIKEVNTFLSVNKGWNKKKDVAVKNLTGTLKSIFLFLHSQVRFLRHAGYKDDYEKALAVGSIKKLEVTAEKLDDQIENLELVIGFYNKEKDNDLQIALDRAKDKDDPVITGGELRKLLGL